MVVHQKPFGRQDARIYLILYNMTVLAVTYSITA